MTASAELLGLAGIGAESKAAKQVANQIAKDVHHAKEYVASLRKEIEAEKQESESCLIVARKEARKITDAAQEVLDAENKKIKLLQQDIRAQRLRLEEWEGALTAKQQAIAAQEKVASTLEIQAQAELATAQSMQAEAQKARIDCRNKLDRTLEIWQRST